MLARADARLVIEVPHWSAAVAVIDNDLKTVESIGKIVAGANGTGQIEAELPAGAYEVQVTLDGKTQALWAVLGGGETKMIPASSWDRLGIETAMPLAQPQPTAGADDQLADCAAKASKAPPLPTERRSDAPAARLSIFATAIAPDGGEPADFDLDVRLLDEDGALVVDLAAPGSQPSVVPGRLWQCAFDLEPGYYVLRVRDGEGWRLQPLYLCTGMESHLFLRCDGAPQLGSMSLDMGRLGEGYDPEQDRTVAADAVLTALRQPNPGRLIFGSERLNDLVRGEDRNPWLAVLAAYALQSGDHTGEAGALLAEIRIFLRHGPLVDHPDVIALLIDDYPPDAPIHYPPMLRAGVQRLSAYAMDKAGAIARGSPLDRLGTRLIADSAWTAWSEAAPAGATAMPATVMPAPAGDEIAASPAAVLVGEEFRGKGAETIVARWRSRLLTWAGLAGLKAIFASIMPARPAADMSSQDDAVSGAVSLPAPMRALVQAFPANAPVYPLTEHRDEISREKAIAEGATIATHAALIEAAITGLPFSDTSPPTAVRVAMQDGGADLLDVSAEAVSRLSGMALDKVVRHFRQLKEAEPVEAVTAIAGDLRSSLGTLIAAIEAKQSGTDAGADARVPTRIAPVEDEVERLQAESARLRSYADTAGGAIGARATAVAVRLAEAADRLLQHAYLVIIADASGTLRYGNRLLRDRLLARGQAGRDALQRLRSRLAEQTEPYALIAAQALSPTSPEAQADVSVAVQRTIVHGSDGSLQGHVYYLRDAAVRDLDQSTTMQLHAALSQITLQVSLVEFGSGDGPEKAVEQLEIISSEIAKILP